MQKVSNKQTNDYIVDILKNNIISGNINEDDDITQEDLAETLNVSRMPVREAIATLIQEGFMERLPNRRVKIVKLTNVQIEEVFIFVSSLERQMTKILVKKEFEFKNFLEIKNILKSETQLSKIIDIEISFHNIIAKDLENKYISLIFDKVFNGYPNYAIKNKGLIDEKKDNINKLLDIILNKEVDKIDEAFDRYYMFYANKF